MNYLDCEYANVADNGTGEIKFPRDDKFRKLSSAINIVTSDYMYDLDNVADYLRRLDEFHITYIWTDSKNRMHPTNLKDEAERIIAFAEKEYQWIVFTDSLFFVKELRLLAKQKKLDVKYFNLYFENDSLSIEESDDMYSLRNFSLLNESISQFQREIDLVGPSFIE
jgi:hypothetical protein|nr:MAG TPA: hypothetical protein [Bacteriophage sp.]